MPPLLPRYQPDEGDDPLEAILREADAKEARVREEVAAGVTAGGDGIRMRGVPIIGRGSSGAMPRTAPLAELIRRESRR